MKTITVKVEQRHIDAGYRGSSRRCPIALALVEALARVLPFQPVLSVGGYHAQLLTDDGSHTIELDDACNMFQLRFDDGEPCEPFTFNITFNHL